MKYVLLFLLGWQIMVYVYRKPWIYHSLNYFKKRRRVDRLFKGIPKIKRRDLWLDSIVTADLSKWYNSRLENYIRTKYINEIIDEYGAIRTS